MKKFLTYIIALAALISCGKDELCQQQAAAEVVCNFTAKVSPATKNALATVSCAQRCIMEIYYNEELYKRETASVTADAASFTVSVVANRTYDVLFWADSAEPGSESAYYETASLEAVSFKSGYAGNDAARDAFCASRTDVMISTGGGSFAVELDRPFAKVDVITSDGLTVTPDNIPDQVSVTLKNVPTTLNVLTRQVSGNADLIYQAAPLNTPDGTSANVTLSSDFVLADSDNAEINMEWTALKDGNVIKKHSFSAMPVHCNYCTNIRGSMLTE